MLADKFQILKELGSGSFGDVYLVKALQSDQYYACKIKKPTNSEGITDSDLIDVQNEVQFLSEMQNSFIINIQIVGRGNLDLLDGSEPFEVLYILMDYVENGELFSILKNTGKFQEPLARYYFQQLLSALYYLHSTCGVCHRDIKLENILIDANMNIKLSDFGFCTLLANAKGSTTLKDVKGTPGYMAPEMFKKKGYNGVQTDLFAAGVCLFMMVSQCQPFNQAKARDEHYKYIHHNKPAEYWSIYEKCAPMSEELKDLLFKMMNADPSKRLSLEEIVMHPWTQGPVPSNEEVIKEFATRFETISSQITSTSTITSQQD